MTPALFSQLVVALGLGIILAALLVIAAIIAVKFWRRQ